MSVHADDMVLAVARTHNHCFCAWCQGDLGLLWYPSRSPSYGICASCQRAYFAEYYLRNDTTRTSTTDLKERIIGMDVPI
jgi:hypothetical protein